MERLTFFFLKMETTCSRSYAEKEGSGEGDSGYKTKAKK